MYNYNFYLGYERETGGFPLLGTIEYPSPLQKGDVVFNQIFEEIEKAADAVPISGIKYNQQYRIASIHHTIDSKVNLIPNIYLLTESDYLEKYKG